ncbi:hypothetical protein ACQPU1_02080 [Clostridium paraputrificum]|uniref:hypothetical protein n=1 Tax=Clostridium paraputrificum TaxID=29363 RepID=UPI003D32C910
MIKKFVSLVALSVVLVSETATIAPKAMVNVNSYCPSCIAENTDPETNEDAERHKDKDKDKCKEKCGHHKHDIQMLSQEQILKLLSESEKKELKEICDCVNSGKELSKSQMKTLHSLKEKVGKCILGDKDFKEFKKLMKKSKDDSLNEDEKCKLQEYLKKIKEAK